MTRQPCRFSIFLWLIGLSISVTGTAQTVDIPDPNLRTAIGAELGKFSGAPITVAEMAALTHLESGWNSNQSKALQIIDLTGLEAATNLTSLKLHGNSISDISPLTALTNLTELWLQRNSIADISPLAGLTKLKWLLLQNNRISDISPLTALTNLKTLWLNNNAIADISSLTALTNLTDLWLHNNAIADISPLAGLTNLIELWLNNNSIADTSPLAGLTKLKWLLLRNNLISDISPLASLTNLKTLWLHNNSIADISPLAGVTNLDRLDLHNNSIADLSPLVANTGLRVEDWVDARGNLLNALSINTHIPALQSRGVEVLFDNIVVQPEDIARSLDIPDPNLRAAVEKARGKASGAPIVVADMVILTELSVSSASITDLTGLQHATNLTELRLDDNLIVDISPLTPLTQLTFLGLGVNNITDISAVAGLTHLTQLDLGGNSISDILPLVENTGLGGGDSVDVSGNFLNALSIDTHIRTLQNRGVTVEFDRIAVRPEDIAQTVDIPDPNLRAYIEDARQRAQGVPITVADMLFFIKIFSSPASITDLTGLQHATNLTQLDLGGNSISDISPLTALTNLRNLQLYNNSISDISPLTALTNLQDLDLRNNSIVDISPLAGLTQMKWLLLRNNSISDISPLTALTNLQDLGLSNNSILNISPLASLTQLFSLDLAQNSIVNISPLAGLTQMTVLYLWGNSISDLSSLTGLNNLIILYVNDNSIADISPLAGLTNLTQLNLRDNAIADLSPLVVNAGLEERDWWIYVNGNPLSLLSVNTHIPAIQSKGAFIEFDEVVVQPADVNDDGVVNIFDLVSVASQFGKQGQNIAADVNGDGVVNILDLVFVAGMFAGEAAAPSPQRQVPEAITAVEIQQWLTNAKAFEIRDPIMERGVAVLQQLLAALTPTETELLANYPNPLNPETWIPYRLAEDTLVTLTIYDQTGQVVRTLDVGHKTAAVYESRSKAIYWDGRNQLGEQVASGVYFYHLSTGDFSATRKMLILK